MRQAELYEYRGAMYTIGALSRKYHIHRETIQRRLNMGWTIEEALETPASRALPKLGCEDVGKQIPIVFTSDVPVFQHMQPTLGKTYMATICGSTKHDTLCQVYFTIELENGKQLITYPGEFELLGEI